MINQRRLALWLPPATIALMTVAAGTRNSGTIDEEKKVKITEIIERNLVIAIDQKPSMGVNTSAYSEAVRPVISNFSCMEEIPVWLNMQGKSKMVVPTLSREIIYEIVTAATA
jgi:hypothetical protein